jgi:hypothetical protein
MRADMFGFYLAVLNVGGHLWPSSIRGGGAPEDIAVLALLLRRFWHHRRFDAASRAAGTS